MLVSDLPACYARFTFRPYYFTCVPVLDPRRWFPNLAGDFICGVGDQLGVVVLASVVTQWTPPHSVSQNFFCIVKEMEIQIDEIS